MQTESNERGHATVSPRHSRDDEGHSGATQAEPELDEALERLARTDFELANGFVNHGPMACEALAALGRCDEIERWARRCAGTAVGHAPQPVEPAGESRFDWRSALGSYDQLPEWLGFYGRTVDEIGWEQAVQTWVPRLMPGLATALFHGAIRTAHAVRAVSRADTAPRRAELARSLAYWSARFRPGEDAAPGNEVASVRDGVVEAAAVGASCYLTRPSIFNLHGVTGAMALEILVGHLPADRSADALWQIRAEHAALYRGVAAATRDAKAIDAAPTWMTEWVDAAAQGSDVHEVKLVEACRRGLAASGDARFAAAARSVVARR
jgi:hypothetical protein